MLTLGVVSGSEATWLPGVFSGDLHHSLCRDLWVSAASHPRSHKAVIDPHSRGFSVVIHMPCVCRQSQGAEAQIRAAGQGKKIPGPAGSRGKWVASASVHDLPCPPQAGARKKERKKDNEVAQSCPTLCDPMDCSPPGSSVHGILQARILEWVAIRFSRGSFPPRDRSWVSCTAGDSLPSEPSGAGKHLAKVPHRCLM